MSVRNSASMHFQGNFIFWRNLRNFERLKEIFKESQKFNEFWENKDILRKFREF